MSRPRSRLVVFLLAAALSACSLTPARPPLIANHDFGPPSQGARTVAFSTPEKLLLNGVSAPEWLETTDIQYR